MLPVAQVQPDVAFRVRSVRLQPDVAVVSDLIESIHDGSFFGGDWTKLGLFIPAGLVLFVLWLSGLWMWWVPFAAKRRRTSAARPAGTARSTVASSRGSQEA